MADRYVVEAGSCSGIALNTHFSLQSTPLRTSPILAEAEVIEVRPMNCDLRLVSFLGSTNDIPMRFHALQTTFTDEVVTLHLSLDNQEIESMFGKLVETLKKNGRHGLELVPDSDRALMTIRASRGTIKYQVTDKSISRLRMDPDELCFQTEADFDRLEPVLDGAYHFFRHLHRQPAPAVLRTKVQFEVHQVEPSEDLDLETLQFLHQRNSHVNLVGEENTVFLEGGNDTVDARLYGMTITNKWPIPLYVALFYFDCGDLSISMSTIFHLAIPD